MRHAGKVGRRREVRAGKPSQRCRHARRDKQTCKARETCQAYTLEQGETGRKSCKLAGVGQCHERRQDEAGRQGGACR